MHSAVKTTAHWCFKIKNTDVCHLIQFFQGNTPITHCQEYQKFGWSHNRQQVTSGDPGPLEAMMEVRHPAPPVSCPQFCRHIREVSDLLSPPTASGWAAAPGRRERWPRTGSRPSPVRLYTGVWWPALTGQWEVVTGSTFSLHYRVHSTRAPEALGGSLLQEYLYFFPWATVSLWSYAHCESRMRFFCWAAKKSQTCSLSHINSLPLEDLHKCTRNKKCSVTLRESHIHTYQFTGKNPKQNMSKSNAAMYLTESIWLS